MLDHDYMLISDDELRLRMGELTSEELLIARAAYGLGRYHQHTNLKWVEKSAAIAKELLLLPCFDEDVESVRSERGLGLSHLKWMLTQLANKEVGSETKSCRWLGYAQGMLISLGATTLGTEKARNAMVGPSDSRPKSLTFQSRVKSWVLRVFGKQVASDLIERGDRFLEEALEFLQSLGYPKARVPILLRYVYGRPVGEPKQEVGGTMVTMAALCAAAELDMYVEGERELSRIWNLDEKIRGRQDAKRHLFDCLKAPDEESTVGASKSYHPAHGGYLGGSSCGEP